MITAVFDGNFESLLELAAFLYEGRFHFDAVSDKEGESSLFDENIYSDKSAIVKTEGLDVERLKTVFLACDKDVYRLIVKRYFEAMDGAFTMESTARARELESAVNREAHKFKGFIRFEQTELGFFARISPKNNVLPIIAPHFWRRFGDDRVIFDDKRGVAAIISKGGYRFVSAKLDRFEKSDNEREFERLWRKFFESVSIKERQNKKLQQNFVPLRYREHMGEFAVTPL